MKFRKSLNNNAALANDEQQHEYVVIGTGISFGQHPGDQVDETKVQRRFIADDTLTDELASLSEVQSVALRVTEKLVRSVEEQLAVHFTQYQYLALTDHLDLTIKRLTQGIALPDSTMDWMVRRLYPLEYHLVNRYLSQVNDSGMLSFDLPPSEAAALVLHVVNVENKQVQVQATVALTKLMAGVMHIIQLEQPIQLDPTSFNYSRFVTHLRAFMVNHISGIAAPEPELDPAILQLIQVKYPHAYQIVQRIVQYLRIQQGWQLSNNEQVYLTLHVWRVTHKQTIKK